MKKRRENNFKLFFHPSLFVSFLWILTTIKPTNGTSLPHVEIDANQGKAEAENGKGSVAAHPNCSPGSFKNLFSMLSSYQSEMKEVTGRLNQLENTVVVLNDRVVDQEKKIYALNSKNKRERRQTKSLQQYTRLPCAFDFPRKDSKKPSETTKSLAQCTKLSYAFDFPGNDSKIPSQTSDNYETSSLPMSCSDLSKLGHTLNGIYPVQGSDLNTNKIALVFCQFRSSAAFGKKIPADKKLGFVDLKSMPNRVAFFAHRDYPLWSGPPSIPFYLSKLNQGGALNLTTGVFTPPVNGTYAFHFRALVKDGDVGVKLYHNDYMVTTSWFDGGTKHGLLGISAALKLTTGDIVKLHLYGSGYIQDNDGYGSTFTGWLLEENLSFQDHINYPIQ